MTGSLTHGLRNAVGVEKQELAVRHSDLLSVTFGSAGPALHARERIERDDGVVGHSHHDLVSRHHRRRLVEAG